MVGLWVVGRAVVGVEIRAVRTAQIGCGLRAQDGTTVVGFHSNRRGREDLAAQMSVMCGLT